MKKLLLASLLLIAINAKGQNPGIVYSVFGENAKVDSAKAIICKDRGHVGYAAITTLAYCPEYIVDTDSTSVIVKPSCNQITYRCRRCYAIVSERDKEVRTTVWRKKNQ